MAQKLQRPRKTGFGGFTNCLMHHGIEAADISFADNYSYLAGKTAMSSLLERTTVDAVFCGDDLICMGAMDAARSNGLSIPQDIGFLGFNDMTMSGWAAYDLTTIRQPTQDIILSSIDLVVAMVEEPQRSPESRLFPCSIVERSSLRPLPIGDCGRASTQVPLRLAESTAASIAAIERMPSTAVG